MGRWEEKDAVEDYCALRIQKVKEYGYILNCEGSSSGGIAWSSNGEQRSAVGIEGHNRDGERWLILKYHSVPKWEGEEKREFHYRIDLEPTPCHFGGERWWFICPLIANGVPCLRRVGVLYSKNLLFGCRHCHRLNYQSSKDSHKLDNWFRERGLSIELGNKLWKSGDLF